MDFYPSYYNAQNYLKLLLMVIQFRLLVLYY